MNSGEFLQYKSLGLLGLITLISDSGPLLAVKIIRDSFFIIHIIRHILIHEYGRKAQLSST